MTSPATNIADHLPRMAARQPHTHAVVFPESRDRQGRVSYTHFTYHQLDLDSQRIARGLGEHGIDRGTRVVLMVPPGLDFFALTFALFRLGAIPILIDPGLGVKNLGACLTEARPQAFIGVPRAQVARLLFRWGRSTVRKIVTVGTKTLWGGVTLEDIRRQGDRTSGPIAPSGAADEIAAILFTSGSTGPPKGAVYSHGNFLAQVEMIRSTYEIQPGEIDLPTFPLFALFAPALGMTAIIPEMDATRPAHVDPRRIFEAIENFGVTNMFGSPALLDTVSRHGERAGTRLPTLRRVLSAGAPVHATILARFTKMLSAEAEIHTPYGATEALPVCSIGSGEILRDTGARAAEGHGVCVGHTVDGARVDIIRIDDDPIEGWSDDLLVDDGETGEIAVRGAMVTESYFNRDEATRLAKIRGPEGETIHRMGDLGYRDRSGRIWFCGRKSQRVTAGDRTLFTVPCEGVFNGHRDVHRAALVGVPRHGGTEPVICVEPEAADKVGEARLRQELLEIASEHPLTREIRTVLFHPSFPVDIRHNAKIFREKLAKWAARRLAR